MNSRETSLGDFVQQLLLELGERELHFKYERPWHELFYQLKSSPDTPGKPEFLRTLFFDWNGDYPKCQELSEYLHALHWTGCMTAANPGYDHFKLNRDVGDLWRTDVDEPLRAFIQNAAQRGARELAV